MYLSIVNRIDGVKDVGSHDDLTIDGEDGIVESLSDETNDTLHTGDFLIQENVQGNGHAFLAGIGFRVGASELLDAFSDFDVVVVDRQSLEHFLGLVLHDIFSGLATSDTRVLRSCFHDCVNHFATFFQSECKICVSVQTKDLCEFKTNGLVERLK